MKSKALLLIIIFCFFTSLTVSGSYRQPDTKILLKRDHPLTEMVKLSCICNSTKVTEKFNATMTTIFEITNFRKTCPRDKQARICELLEECENCSAEIETCKFNRKPGIDLKWLCRKLTYNLETNKAHIIQLDSLYKDEDLASNLLRRKRRQLIQTGGVCGHPQKLGNSVLTLGYHLKYLHIIQRCKYGYTLSDGISRNMRCNYEENIWYPTGLKFEACQPFINCKIGLSYHGRANCTKGTTDKAVMCHVSCPHYEDKPAEKGTYVCDIDGEWKPELPHCVHMIQSMELVPAPKIKLHSLEQEATKISVKVKKTENELDKIYE